MGVVHFNSGCHTSSVFRENMFGGVSDIPVVAELENKRKRKCVATAATKAKKPRVRGTETEGVAAYGGDYSDDMEPRALDTAINMIMEKLKRNQVRQKSIEDESKNDEHFFNEKIMNMLMSYYFSNIINSKGPKFYPKILGESSTHIFSLLELIVLFKNSNFLCFTKNIYCCNQTFCNKTNVHVT